MRCRWFFAIICQLLVQSSAKEEFVFPEPEACPKDAEICGDDPEKYPAKEIDIKLQEASETHHEDTMKRFFSRDRQPFKTCFDNFEEEKTKATCDFRNEKLPRYPRMRNVNGDLVYVGQGSDKEQIIEIVYCENPDQPCKIDSDSPGGEGTTTCKQMFRTYKMLAVTRTGELVVDTFKFPSACVCHFKEPLWGVRSGLDAFLTPKKSNQKAGPTCSPDISTHKLEQNENQEGRNFQVQPQFPKFGKLGWSDIKITPCSKGKIICDSDDWEYPVDRVNALMNTHIAFKSPVFFEKLFGDVCDPDVESVISTRTLFFEPDVSNLCATSSKYFYPRKIEKAGRWFLIINTERYRQGVTSDECMESALKKPCKYGGAVGWDPEVKSQCLQVCSLQYFLVVDDNGKLSYEVFNVPSTCSCYTQH